MAERTTTPLTRWVSSILQKNLDDFEFYFVEPVDNFVYHVKGGTKDRVVNLTNKTYICHRFNLDLIPYSHACAAIRYVYNCFLYLHMLYYIIIFKITYSICLLVFRSARKKIDQFLSPYYKKKDVCCDVLWSTLPCLPSRRMGCSRVC